MEQPPESNKRSKEASIETYVRLIKAYSANATYFVRKISAQAILPLIKFDEYVSKEIPECFAELLSSIIEEGKKPLRQNHAHGVMVRINVFLSAYLQYRDGASK